MQKQKENKHTQRNWVLTLAVTFIVIGVLAVSIPLVWQKINYIHAERVAAELEAEMQIPKADKYQPVDYATMEKGETPIFTPEEMQQAGDVPDLLEELGIVGEPSGFLYGIAEARAEEEEPSSMREALNRGAQALHESREADVTQVMEALASARKQVENTFFLLTAVQPITDTEQLASLNDQTVQDGLSRGDKTITAARELIYTTLAELEGLLKQVEDLASRLLNMAMDETYMDLSQRQLTTQLDTLASYMRMMALHLPEDDFQSSLALHEAIVNRAAQEQSPENTAQYDPIDMDQNGVKRSYLLEIPDIKVKVACYRSGTFNVMYKNMRSGVAMFPRAPEPNTIGNICISGHRTGTRDFFRKLDKLSAGDTIYLHTSHLGSFQYEVTKVFVIEKDDWSVTYGTDYPALTLLSCEAYQGVGNGRRIVVRAKLIAVAGNEN